MDKINILIVEDEFLFAKQLQTILGKMGYQVVGVASSFDSAVALLDSTNIDLAIIDITLEGEPEGFQIANFINERIGIPFIYVTSYADRPTIQQAKKTLPSSYIIKPFQKESIFAAVELAMFNYQQQEKNNKKTDKQSFIVKQKDTFVKVFVEDIMYFTTERNYAECVTPNGKHLIRKTMAELEKEFASQRFVRIHKSFLVNLNFLTSHSYEEVEVNHQIKLPIGRAYSQILSELLKP